LPNKPYSIALNEQLVEFLESLGMELYFGETDTNLFEYNLVRDFARKLKLLNYRSEGRIIDRRYLEQEPLISRLNSKKQMFSKEKNSFRRGN
jgi:hypothetical protein